MSNLPKRVSEFEARVRGENRLRKEIDFLSEHVQATGAADLPVVADSKELSNRFS